MTTLSVTATEGGNTANGILLRILVLTNAAATQDGATASLSTVASSACQTAITTTQTGSQVYGAVMKGINTSFTANANTTLLDNITDGTQFNQYGTVESASATGSPGTVTIGASSPASADETNVALFEVLPSGTITQDPSAPASVSTLTNTTVATASFTPPDGSLLVALVSSDGLAPAGHVTMSVTDSSGLLTWTEQVNADTTVGYCGVWTAVVQPTPPGDPVVTATQSGNTANGMFLQVFVLDNAVMAATPATAITYVTGATAYQTSITTTQTGSFVFGAINEGNITTAPTPLGNTTIYSTFTDSTNTNQYSSFKTTSATGTPGATTVGSSSTGASAGTGIAAIEVLASGGTLTVDASTPAGVGTETTSAATAAFTPPAGSLLLAVIVTNGNATGAPTITITGTLGLLGLTWTQGVNANAVTDGFFQDVGVWYARVPGGTGPKDVPQFSPGPTWLDIFKPGMRKPRPPQPALAVPSVSCTGSFSLAPLHFTAAGSQSSPDQRQIQPGPVWLDLFKPGFLKPRPVPPAVQSVNATGSFSLAPLAFSSQGSQTSPDIPGINPGTTWLDLFKPQWQKPRPYLLDPGRLSAGTVSSTGSFALAPFAFLAQGSQTSPDQPQVSPGTTWLRLFRPDLYKSIPVPPAQQSVNATGSFSLASLAFQAAGNQTSPDIPQVQPGPAWFKWFKPGLHKPVPPVAAVPGVSVTGSFTLAPIAFVSQGSQTSLDVPQIFPGTTWLDLFKPGLPKPRPVPPAIPSVNGTGSFALAPLAFSASAAAISGQPPGQSQIAPGPAWLSWFKRLKRPQPQTRFAGSGVTESGSFNIYLPGGCIRFGPLAVTLPALKVVLQGYAGRFGPVTVALPSPVTSLTGLHSPLWPGFRIPALRVSLTGKIQGGAFNITLPAPKTAITGTITHVHSGPFALSLTCKSGMGGIVWLSLAPPAPSPDPVDWIASQPVTAWRTYLPSEAWSVGYASVTISHLSTQYVLIPVQASKNGSSYNPTSDTVQFAFAPTPTYVPQVSDWVSGSWVTNSNNILYPYSAQCLVGPGGTALGLGTYQIYIKISDSPETPVLVAGQVVITLWKSRWVMFMFPGPQTSPQSPGRQDNGNHSFHDVH